MPAKIAIDEKLVAEAMRLGKRKTREAAINAALKEYVERLAPPKPKKKQKSQAEALEALRALGPDAWDPNYDYKAERRYREEKLRKFDEELRKNA